MSKEIKRGDLLVIRSGKVMPATRDEILETMVHPILALENMENKIAKQLKDAGFPTKPLTITTPEDVNYPTLSELIEACGVNIKLLCGNTKSWATCERFDSQKPPIDFEGETPEEAVAKLWLKLKDN